MQARKAAVHPAGSTARAVFPGPESKEGGTESRDAAKTCVERRHEAGRKTDLGIKDCTANDLRPQPRCFRKRMQFPWRAEPSPMPEGRPQPSAQTPGSRPGIPFAEFSDDEAAAGPKHTGGFPKWSQKREQKSLKI